MWYIFCGTLLCCINGLAVAPSFSSNNLCEYAIRQRKDKQQLAAMIEHYFNKDGVKQQSGLYPEHFFITDTEFKELEIPWLIDIIDYTQTALGRRFLHQTSVSATTNITITQERQRIEQLLYENPELLQKIQTILHKISKEEKNFLSYFDDSDRLHMIARDLYFDGSSIRWMSQSAADIVKKGNNHSSVLNLNVISSLIKRCDSLFISLCKQSMADSLIKIALGMSTTLDLDVFLFDNIINTAKGHMPWFSEFNAQTYNGDHQTYSAIMQGGTFADKIGAYVCGSTATDTSIGFKILPIKWRWNIRKQADFSAWDNVPWYKKTIAALSLLGWTLYKDYRILQDGKDSVKKIQLLFNTMRTLRNRLVRVVQIINNLHELCSILKSYPEFKESPWVQQLNLISAATNSKQWKEMMVLLGQATFHDSTSNVYNYGVVLRAHALLCEIKNTFIPVLEAVGEIDAYCSIATLLQRHHKDIRQFSFVQFLDTQEPVISLHDCWVPLINSTRVVANDIFLGLHGWGNKIIITGPNGGGKSTYLKALGHSVYLAHTFGIVPASQGVMSIYSGLRTCFHPRESLSEDMSQFMVEKRCMDTLEEYAKTQVSDQKIMLLIDEPYRGTVDAESAERIYTFGNKIAQIPYVSTVIATHVYKPITLAQDTNGIFTNCQVVINQLSDTLFERTFKIAPDVAYWWFVDAEKRAQFVDWLAAQ